MQRTMNALSLSVRMTTPIGTQLTPAALAECEDQASAVRPRLEAELAPVIHVQQRLAADQVLVDVFA
jgi:hypothetical protein